MLTMPRLAPPLPEGLDPELIDAGLFFDFVRVPGHLGDRILAELDEHSGAAIRDPYAHLLYWLIRPGAADGWRFPTEADVRILGTGSSVLVPPPHCDGSAAVYWTQPVRAGRVLSPARRLHDAMQAVISKAVMAQ